MGAFLGESDSWFYCDMRGVYPEIRRRLDLISMRKRAVFCLAFVRSFGGAVPTTAHPAGRPGARPARTATGAGREPVQAAARAHG